MLPRPGVLAASLAALVIALAAGPSGALEAKARLCVVGRADGNGSAAKYCPILDVHESPAVCVIAHDRLECLRFLMGGRADFAVLQAEELLVASRLSNAKVLVTSELRLWRQREYEEQMLVIVRNTLNLTGVADLRGKKFCHPGYDIKEEWTAVTSKFFELKVVPQRCDPTISVVENFIKSSSEYFGAACKPGPWVNDEALDSKFKSKYRNMCQLCDVPRSCSSSDKYWGREGALMCLSDEAGDVAWVKLSDVLVHFAIDHEGPGLAVPAEFSALCTNGSLQSLAPLTKNSPPPCSWMSRPWGVVAAREKIAQDIMKLVTSLNKTTSYNWQWALRYFLTTNNHEIIPVEIITPEDYLAKGEGSLVAGSAPCGVQRAIKWCVGSLMEEKKCRLWREAALAHGVEPPLACVQPPGDRGCVEALAEGAERVEAVVVRAQQEALARRLGLKPLLYEYPSKRSDYYISSVIVKENSKIEKLSDLRGKRACFMNHMGIGWHSLLNALKKEGLLPPICPYEKAISSFFSEACVPGLNNSITSPEEYAPNLETLCRHTDSLKGRPPKHVSGEQCCRENADAHGDAFHCLTSGDGDVAIVEMGTADKPTGKDEEPWAKYIASKNYRVICTREDEGKSCHIGWSPKGLVMSSANLTSSRLEELYMLLLQMDNVFGKHGKIPPHFSLYGPYDGHRNVIFQDSTHYLVKIDALKKASPMKHNYEDILNNVMECSSARCVTLAAWIVSFSSLSLHCI